MARRRSRISGTGVATPNTGIFSISNGTGDAGAVNVIAIGNVTLSSGGQIASVVTGTNGGNAKSVTLTLNPDNRHHLSLRRRQRQRDPAIPDHLFQYRQPHEVRWRSERERPTLHCGLQPGAAIQTSSQDTTAGDVFVRCEFADFGCLIPRSSRS